ncbi:hypothetical protein D3C87_666640 [compost metagenome]
MAPFIDFGDDMSSPDVKFSFIPFSETKTHSWIQATWRKPEFLSGVEPEQMLNDRKWEVINWMDDCFGHDGYILSEHLNMWSVIVIDDEHSSKLVAFKLRWGSIHNW